MINKKISFIFVMSALFLILSSMQLVLAYNYQINVDSNYAVFNTDVYKCSNSGCSSITFQQSSTSGQYSLIGSGDNYYAEYDYLSCFKPHIYRMHAWGDLTGTENYDITFNKKDNCYGEINDGELSETEINLGESVTINANVHSAFEYPSGIPETTKIPDNIKSEYSTDTKLGIYANGIKIYETTAEILLASDKDFEFEWTPASAGTYEIRAKSEITDCACSSQETQEFLIGILIVKSPKCSIDSDCGTNHYIEDGFCSGTDVFQNFITFKCNNPGLSTSFCSNSTAQIIKQDCGESSCGDFGDNYCKNNSVYHSRTCTDKGCALGSCFSNTRIDEQLVSLCDNGCANGTCNPSGCSKNTDCGTDHDSEIYCSNDDVYKDHHSFLCSVGLCNETITKILEEDCGEDEYGNWNNYCQGDDVYKSRYYANRGCSNKACFIGTVIQNEFVKHCDYDCANGDCIDEPEPVCGNDIIEQGEECDDGNLINGDGCSSICKTEQTECCTDENCTVDYYSAGYCEDNDVYKEFHDFFCSLGFCNQNITQVLITDCGSDSCDAFGNNYCENNSVYHSRTCYNKGCANASCYNNNYDEKVLVNNCTNGCSNGICNPVCSQDSDCADDYYSDKYCSNGDSYKDFHEFSCSSTGTCEEDITKKLVKECDYGCKDGECKDKSSETWCIETNSCELTYDDEAEFDDSVTLKRTDLNQTLDSIILNNRAHIDSETNKTSSCFWIIVIISAIVLLIILIILMIWI